VSRETSAPRILIVDDVPANIKVLGGTLKADYDVIFATNGEDALAIVYSNQLPDLILLDIMMPDMDGYELCEMVKGDPRTRDIPIIFISAKDAEHDETKGLSLGAADYIVKPFSPAIVKARVETQLERRKAEQDRIQKEKLEAVIEIAGAVCHELNQPMQALTTYAELLLTENQDGDSRNRALEKIRDQVFRMRDITRKLNSITRYETMDYVFEGKKIIDIDRASHSG
jgi:PleD family two-component response regulator